MTEANETSFNEEVIEKIKASGKPLLFLINKVDTITPAEMEAKIKFWQEKFSDALVIPVSAKLNFNTDKITNEVLRLLPKMNHTFPKTMN